MFFTVNN